MDTKVTRTLLAPSAKEGRTIANKAFALVEQKGTGAIPELQSEFEAEVHLHWAEKARFRREEFFNTGGIRVDVWHPALTKPLGTCDDGKFYASGACGDDAFFRIPEEAKKKFAHPADMNLLCPKHRKMLGF